MKYNKKLKLLTFLILCNLNTNSFAAPQLTEPGSWAVTWENDLISPANTDRHYTNGISVSKTFDPVTEFNSDNTFEWFLNITDWLPINANKNWHKKHTMLSIGQIMQTPEEIETITPDPNDAPYAGFLYFTHGIAAFNDNYADLLTVQIGVTGPASLAESFQGVIHSITDSTEPLGWDSQIPNEVTLNFSYSRLAANSLTSIGSGWQIGSIKYGIVNVGTAQTNVAASYGFSLHENTFNILTVQPGRLSRNVAILKDSHSTGWSFISAVTAKAVVWDILLDGTLFSDSPSVDKETLVGEVIFSFTYSWGESSLNYLWTMTTSTFKHDINELGGLDHYGSLSYSWRY